MKFSICLTDMRRHRQCRTRQRHRSSHWDTLPEEPERHHFMPRWIKYFPGAGPSSEAEHVGESPGVHKENLSGVKINNVEKQYHVTFYLRKLMCKKSICFQGKYLFLKTMFCERTMNCRELSFHEDDAHIHIIEGKV